MNYTFIHRPNSGPAGQKENVNFPFRIDTIEAFQGFQRAGYIKICHIPDAEWLDDPYWWLVHVRNIFYWRDHPVRTVGDFREMPRSNLNSGVWSLLLKIMNYRSANDELERFRNLDDEEAASTVLQQYIPKFMEIRKNRLNFMWDKRYHNECGMYTDLILVHEPYRGTGLAEQLYYKAALWGKKIGKRYRFSNCQSDAAKKVMRRFAERGMITQERRRMHNRVYTFNYLDTIKPLWLGR